VNYLTSNEKSFNLFLYHERENESTRFSSNGSWTWSKHTFTAPWGGASRASWVDGECVAPLSYCSPVSQHLPATIKSPPLPPLLSSVRPSSAPPVLISDDPSPPPRKVRNFHPPQKRTNSNLVSCPGAALALSGVRRNAWWVGSPCRGSGDPRPVRWRDRHEISWLTRDFSGGLVCQRKWAALRCLA
jgi:hypothetical protein